MKTVFNYFTNKMLFAESKLIFQNAPQAVPRTPDAVKTSPEKMLPHFNDLSKEFLKPLVKITTNRKGQKEGDPKLMNQFMNMNPKNQVALIIKFLKAYIINENIKLDEEGFKDTVKEIYENISPHHDSSNIKKLENIRNDLTNNADEIAAEDAKKTLEKYMPEVNKKISEIISSNSTAGVGFARDVKQATETSNSEEVAKKFIPKINQLLIPFKITVAQNLKTTVSNSEYTANKLKDPNQRTQLLSKLENLKKRQEVASK